MAEPGLNPMYRKSPENEKVFSGDFCFFQKVFYPPMEVIWLMGMFFGRCSPRV